MTSVSSFFEKACKGPFKVCFIFYELQGYLLYHGIETDIRPQEAQSNIIDLPEDNPAVVEAMVKYLYSGSYENIFENLKIEWDDWTYLHEEAAPEAWQGKDEEYEYDRILFHLAVYELAEKFDISGLKLKAEAEIKLLIERDGRYIDEDGMGSIIDEVHKRTQGMTSVVKALARAIIMSKEDHILLRGDGHGTLEAMCRWPELSYHLLKRLEKWPTGRRLYLDSDENLSSD